MPCVNLHMAACTSSDGSKSRLIWPFPLDIVASEAMFACPIIDRLTDQGLVSCPENRHRYCGFKSHNVDFSQFDASVPRWLILECFDYLWTRIDTSKYRATPRHPVEEDPYDRTSLELLWDRLVHYFIHTPFRRSPIGPVYHKANGVPSGSMFTNIIDTLASYAIMSYLHAKECEIFTYGDDCAVGNCSCDLSETQMRAMRMGFTMKIDKPNSHGCLTFCKQECHLGRRFRPGVDFRNVIENCQQKYRGDVAICLALMSTHMKQLIWCVEEAARCGFGKHRPPVWLTRLVASGERRRTVRTDPVDQRINEGKAALCELLPSWAVRAYLYGYG